MHTLDIFFLIGAAFFVFVGIRRGLVGEVFRLAAIIAGFLAAFLYYPDLAAVLTISSPYLSTAVSFSIIYAAVFMLVLGAGWIVRKIVHLTPLGWIDYLSGGIIGFMKTAIIFWIVCLSFATFPVTVKKYHLKRSLVYKAYTTLPATVKIDRMVAMRNSLRKTSDHTIPKTIMNSRKNIEQLKHKVDSAKKAEDKRR
ncbi:MAG: CvpA family protein [Chitinispirillaceae bacterium]|nr:CvpA family protein [Chitinispirillaceae bacterium]